MTRRAIGIVRVSQVGGRGGEGFASPAEQRKRIEAACERDELKLTRILDELDVSGRTPLERRHGLREAIEAVEAGEAQVIVAAYFDRLVRSLRVQDELVSRVERAGGQVLAVDVGAVSADSAGQWIAGTMLGAVSEYMARSAGERTAEAQARAVARGVVPWPYLPPGYVRSDDGRLEIDPETAPVVAEAFRLRADGATIDDIRRHLASNGIALGYNAVQRLLSSRLVLGEIRFGEFINLDAHPAIINHELWRTVQGVVVSRGRRARSNRLLARLGVLRCGSCDARMVVGSAQSGRYATYNCPRTGDCERRMSISAPIAEKVVSEAVRAALADMQGRASSAQETQEAEQRAEQAQADLDAAIRAFTGLEGEAVARERLVQLREARDDAVAEAHRLGRLHSAFTIRAGTDWNRLTLTEQRELIRASVDRAIVRPGRGADRITIHLFSE